MSAARAHGGRPDALGAGGPLPHVLREYALVADGERGALVGPHGELAWLCAPRWDSPALFSSLLGGRSHHQVQPVGRYVWGGAYEKGTLIWRGRWVLDDTVVVECADALALPADPGRLVLLRRVTVTGGDAAVRVVLDARTDFDAAPVRDAQHDASGTWSARAGDLRVRWRAPKGVRAHERDGSPVLEGVVELADGESLDLVLEVGEGELPAPVPAPVLWEETRAAWAAKAPPQPDSWSPSHSRHSLAVLHGLTSSTGAMVAAATASLPEHAREGNSYDYRYAWVRDQCYTGVAAFTAGSPDLGDSAVRFVTERLLADGGRLAPAYTTDGRAVPPQTTSPLPGYPGGPVLLGNQVREQFQLDGLGEALQLLAAAARADRLDDDGRAAASAAISGVAARWRDPEAGLWELEDRWWTHSRLTVAAGLRAWAGAQGSAGAPVTGSGGEDPLALADAVMAETAARCRHRSGRWQRAADDERVDAALLLGALRGAVSPQDPRSVATLAAVQAELDRDGYVFRFRHDARPLAADEGAFLLCSYWTALAEAQVGQVPRAIVHLERALAACGPPMLFSEEYDPDQHQMRGNLPQAFVHALALEACARMPGLVEAATS